VVSLGMIQPMASKACLDNVLVLLSRLVILVSFAFDTIQHVDFERVAYVVTREFVSPMSVINGTVLPNHKVNIIMSIAPCFSNDLP
jgi:hypothetical protein